MKKCILFLLFSVLSFGQTPDQMVSFNAAQSLGYSLNASQSHVNSDKCMTKDEALAKYNLSAASMNGYTGTQLVPRSTWVTAAASYVHWYAGSFLNRVDACAYNSDLLILYSSSSILVDAMKFYTDSNLTNVFTGDGNFYISEGKSFQINGAGNLANLLDCAPAYYTFTASSTDNLNDATACGYSPNLTLYAKVATPVVGTILYTNTACTTAYSATVSRWRKLSWNNSVMRYGTSIAEIIICP